MGSVCYFALFTVQVILVIATWFFSIFIYIRLAIFLKPETAMSVGPEGVQLTDDEDDMFENQNKTPFEVKRSMIRRQYESKYLDLNLHFIFMILILTVRTGIYVGLRLTSKQKLIEWTLIKPVVFYLTNVSDFLIVGGVMYFVMRTTPIKGQHGKEREEQSHSAVQSILNSSAETENLLSPTEIDGDEMIRRQRANSSDS